MRFSEHRAPHSWSPPWALLRGCCRWAAAVASDLIHVEADGKFQTPVHTPTALSGRMFIISLLRLFDLFWVPFFKSPDFFFFFFCHSMHKFPNRGSNPCHSIDLTHSCDNTGSLTHCTTGNSKISYLLLLLLLLLFRAVSAAYRNSQVRGQMRAAAVGPQFASVLAIVNCATMNIRVHVSFQIIAFSG